LARRAGIGILASIFVGQYAFLDGKQAREFAVRSFMVENSLELLSPHPQPFFYLQGLFRRDHVLMSTPSNTFSTENRSGMDPQQQVEVSPISSFILSGQLTF
jgi:hypothetical protein